MGNRDQFFTTCRRCGRQILMTYSNWAGKWIPCDPEIKRFQQGGGPETYITPDGRVEHGRKAYDGEFGYRRHRKDCDQYK